MLNQSINYPDKLEKWLFGKTVSYSWNALVLVKIGGKFVYQLFELLPQLDLLLPFAHIIMYGQMTQDCWLLIRVETCWRWTCRSGNVTSSAARRRRLERKRKSRYWNSDRACQSTSWRMNLSGYSFCCVSSSNKILFWYVLIIKQVFCCVLCRNLIGTVDSCHTLSRRKYAVCN